MSRAGKVSVIGAGGHAKVVISTLQAAGIDVEAVLDDRPEARGQRVLGVSVAGPVSDLKRQRRRRAVLGIGDNAIRKRLAAELAELSWVSAVHPGAIVHESAIIGEGAVVFAGAVIQPGVTVGRHAIVNTGATVDHDCVLGDFSHVGPGAHLSGNTTMGEGAFLGTGAATKQGVRIGAWTTVGVGGVVVRDLPDGVIAVGVPARPVRASQRD
jgi:sugar O-acyltransferase (sialic acid O-acetyltransferase NeuD family)